MNSVLRNMAVFILLFSAVMILVSGAAAAVEIKELTAEEIEEIRLFENPASDQYWKLELENPGILTVVKDEFKPLKGKNGSAAEEGGVHSWSFKAEAKGFSLVDISLVSSEDSKMQEEIKRKKYLFAVDLLTEEISEAEILEIRLAENPSTGYRWQLDFKENKALQLLQESYQSSAESSEINAEGQSQSENDGTQILVGQGGIKSWTFRGLEAGYQLLTFELKRSGGKVIKTIEYLVLLRE